jgi:hypothetical protein
MSSWGAAAWAAGFSGPSIVMMRWATIETDGSGADQRVPQLQVQLAHDDDDLAGLGGGLRTSPRRRRRQ